jgi:hypothetical protein
MNASFGFNLRVTAMPGFHLLCDWCYQAMWLFSGAPEDPVDKTVMEMHGTDALYSTEKSWLHSIRTDEQDAQQDAAHRMIQIARAWTISCWSELKFPNEKPMGQIPKDNAHLVDLERTEDEQAQLKTIVERYISQGASGVWRVHGWHLACFSLVLGDTENWNNVSGQWYNEWPVDT